VAQAGLRQGLAPEAHEVVGAREGGEEDLDGHGPVERGVVGPPHDPHAAAAELRLEEVRSELLGHR
jgi:hypothetical protein